MHIDLLKVNDVSERLNICRNQVYKLMSAGDLLVVKIGRSTRIPSSAVEDYVARLVEEAEASLRRNSPGPWRV